MVKLIGIDGYGSSISRERNFDGKERVIPFIIFAWEKKIPSRNTFLKSLVSLHYFQIKGGNQ